MTRTSKKLSAAVITLHSVANYGTQLQALATQEKLKQYFDTVTFINYRRPDTYGKGLVNTFAHGSLLKALAVAPTIRRWQTVFGNFQKRYLNISSTSYNTPEDFTHFTDCADVYFSGSDQVWNTGWNQGIIPPFYLSFVPNHKPRYAFSSSFGQTQLSPAEIPTVKSYLSKFQAISVREESGLKILRNQLGLKNSLRLLDPTLSLPPAFWRKLAPKLKLREPYILIYNLNRNQAFDNYAKELSRRTGLKVYRFCTRYDQIFRYGQSLLIPDILEFITLIDHAQYVLTDSFHTTAFSINLNTEPICLYPPEYSGRLSEFLELVQATACHPKDYQDFSVLNHSTDFSKTTQILNAERLRVDQFLAKAAQSPHRQTS